MTSTAPPRLATWMLLHLMPGDHDEALPGDLLESFHAGRSSAWYCRQVLAALAAQWIRSFFRHRAVLVFAAAWATLSPAWRLLVTRLYHTGNLIGPVWRLPWPWSTVCIFGLTTAEDVLFIWTGVLICLLVLLGMFGTVKHWRVGRALTLSVAGYAIATVCDFAIALIHGPSSPSHAVDWRTLTFPGVMTNFDLWTILMRLPYLIGIALALWATVPNEERRRKLAE